MDLALSSVRFATTEAGPGVSCRLARQSVRADVVRDTAAARRRLLKQPASDAERG